MDNENLKCSVVGCELDTYLVDLCECHYIDKYRRMKDTVDEYRVVDSNLKNIYPYNIFKDDDVDIGDICSPALLRVIDGMSMRSKQFALVVYKHCASRKVYCKISNVTISGMQKIERRFHTILKNHSHKFLYSKMQYTYDMIMKELSKVQGINDIQFNIPLSELNVPQRTITALNKCGIFKISDILYYNSQFWDLDKDSFRWNDDNWCRYDENHLNSVRGLSRLAVDELLETRDKFIKDMKRDDK